MRIRLQNTEEYLDVDISHPYQLGEHNIYEEKLKPKLQEVIDKKDLRCDGCGESLKDKAWICVTHRPMSAMNIKENLRIENSNTKELYVNGVFEIKNIWAIFLFCHETQYNCVDKWKDHRPK